MSSLETAADAVMRTLTRLPVEEIPSYQLEEETRAYIDLMSKRRSEGLSQKELIAEALKWQEEILMSHGYTTKEYYD